MFERYKDSKVRKGNTESVYGKVHLLYFAVGLFLGLTLTPLLGDKVDGVFALVFVVAAIVFYFLPDMPFGKKRSSAIVATETKTKAKDVTKTEVKDERQ